MTKQSIRFSQTLLVVVLALVGLIGHAPVQAQARASAQSRADYLLGPGDTIRVQVFQNPDLTLETRVTEGGSITYPLVGVVQVGGLPTAQVEKRIADALQKGGFINQPQVTVVLIQMRGNQVAVLGQVTRPGRFPLETASTRLSDMLALAGSATSGGGDIAIVTGLRNGQPFRLQIDIPDIFLAERSNDDILLEAGDVIYVRGSHVSVLGQVARPGRFPLETASTRLSDALAIAGGATPTGDDIAIVTGVRNGKSFHKQVDIPSIFFTLRGPDDIVLQGGDTIYVNRAPIFYIYGEAQRPGSYRIERGMTIMQALAQGGGPTPRGTERRLRLHRKAADGSIGEIEAQLTDPVLPNDVIYVKESIF